MSAPPQFNGPTMDTINAMLGGSNTLTIEVLQQLMRKPAPSEGSSKKAEREKCLVIDHVSDGHRRRMTELLPLEGKYS